MTKSKNIFLFLAAWIFFILRYVCDDQIAAIHDFASYGIEIVFVLVMGFFLKDQISLKASLSKKAAGLGLLSLIAGYCIFKAAIYGEVLIPFEFDSLLTVFALLIVAPILEELLFRFVFIGANSKLIKNQTVLVLFSATAFSLAHFNALRYVPELVKGFVIYQGVYTFFLGAACALVYLKTERKILNAIGVHFLFNLGFFLASRV